MVTFVSKNISHNHELIAQELKQARIEKKIDLKKAAQKTGINQKYLEAMESGRFDKLPAGVYGKNFLKEYTIFLRLDPNFLLSLYNESETGVSDAKYQKIFLQRITGFNQAINFPRVIKSLIIIIITVVCLFYLGVYLKKITAAPLLILSEPTANTVISNNLINIIGKTDPETQIKINDELILVKTDGAFIKEVNLKEGLNTITIVAQKKYGQKNEIIRKIFVKSEQKP